MTTVWLLLMLVVVSSLSVHSQTSGRTCRDGGMLGQMIRNLERLLQNQQQILENQRQQKLDIESIREKQDDLLEDIQQCQAPPEPVCEDVGKCPQMVFCFCL